MTSKKLLAAMLLVLAMIATACAGDDAGDDGDADTTDSDAGDDGDADAGGGDVSGEITILHAFTGDADVDGLQAVIDGFTEANPDVTVLQEGSNDFESLARTRVGSGTPPDIMLHPQPGLLEDFASQGVVQPLDEVDPSVGGNLVGGLLDLTTFDGELYAFPLRLSYKSLVWYNQPVFEAAGYEVPTTWDEMLELTDQIASDGEYAPWCIGIESGDATGWTATDWVEDILLRTIGLDDYNAWVAGDLGFSSPEVQGAIEDSMVPIWTNDDYVNGGQANIARENFGTAVNGILGGEDGECVLHRQATFIEGFISESFPDAEFGTDYNFFNLPLIDESIGLPALGAGDLAARYTDNEAAVAFIEFLTTPESGEGWASQGGFLSPFTDFDGSNYPTDSARNASDLLSEADFFAFDGSDLMPGDVGSSSQQGSFWLEMTNWVSGNTELGEALANIDALYEQVGTQ